MDANADEDTAHDSDMLPVVKTGMKGYGFGRRVQWQMQRGLVQFVRTAGGTGAWTRKSSLYAVGVSNHGWRAVIQTVSFTTPPEMH